VAAEVATDLVGDIAGQLPDEAREFLKAAVNLAGDIPGQLPDEAKEFLKAAVDLAGDLPREAREVLKEALAVGRFAVKVLQGPMARRANP
jgi:cation transport regulator ChaB